MNSTNIRRRSAVARGSRWLLAATVVAIVSAPPKAIAGKAMKGDFFYQEKPKDGKSCGNCKLFLATGSDKGACAVVDGEISPNGWCMAYSPRN